MRTRTVVSALLGVALLGTTVQGTVLVPADLGVLVSDAEAIIHGRIVDVQAVWVEGRRRIDSLVSLEVLASYKGGFDDAVTVRVPGGQLGRYRSVVVGAPVFRPGDEVVLFLGARGPSVPYVLGLSQGVFRVVVDGEGRKLVVPPPLIAGDQVEVVVRGASTRRPLALEAFAETVRDLLAGRAAGP